jgi:hypothetical protein
VGIHDAANLRRDGDASPPAWPPQSVGHAPHSRLYRPCESAAGTTSLGLWETRGSRLPLQRVFRLWIGIGSLGMRRGGAVQRVEVGMLSAPTFPSSDRGGGRNAEVGPQRPGLRPLFSPSPGSRRGCCINGIERLNPNHVSASHLMIAVGSSCTTFETNGSSS